MASVGASYSQSAGFSGGASNRDDDTGAGSSGSSSGGFSGGAGGSGGGGGNGGDGGDGGDGGRRFQPGPYGTEEWWT